MQNLLKTLQYFYEHKQQFLETYQAFIEIPSISTDREYNEKVNEACTFLVQNLRSLDAEVQVFPTDLHPIVYAEMMSSLPNSKTLLIYGHYDVQPPNPLEKWVTPPFEPTIRADNLYGRGASDMKGQIMACLAALECILRTTGVPINIKFLFEGEEEIGSPSLNGFIESHQELLRCDMVLNPDSGMVGPDSPTIVYGLRGLLYFEVRVDGPKADLHSGLFGGNVANPAIVLSEIISKLHNPNGTISVPGFYDEVLALTQEERAKIASMQDNTEELLTITGVPQLYGEEGFTTLERAGARPTLDVNGFYSGFIGEGSKTIIPAYAKAKISCRLVPNQDADKVYKQIQNFIADMTPPTVHLSINKNSGAPAYLADDAPGVKQLIQALEETWQKPVVYKRDRGSIPVATTLQRILGVKSMLTGFGLPGDNIHSPNEHQHLPTWEKGVQALIRFIESFNHE